MAERLEIDVDVHSDQAQKGIGALISGMGGLAGIASGALTVGLGAAAAALAGVGAGLAYAVNEAMDAQDVLAQTNAVLESTGGIAGVTAEMATELAGSLSEVTRYSDETVLAGENILLTFTNIGQDVFPQATQTILDMSTALGQDLQASAVQLGKALQDPVEGVSALRRVGVSFSEAQQEMIRGLVESGQLMEAQKFILQELQVEFGGSAEAAGSTFAGQLDILRNRLSNVAEEIGNVFLPVIQQVFTNTLMPILDNLLNKAQPVIDAFKQFFANVEAGMSPVQAFRYAFEGLIPEGFQGLFNAVLDGFRQLELLLLKPEVQAALQEVGRAISRLVQDDMIRGIQSMTQSFRVFADLVSESGPAIVTILNSIADLINFINNNSASIQAFSAGGFSGLGSQMGAQFGQSLTNNSNFNNYGPTYVYPQTASDTATEQMSSARRQSGR